MAVDYGWPEDMLDGVYLWWDWRWGDDGTGAEGESPCLYVFYDNVEPLEAWPDMPDGWSHEDTAPWAH